MRVEPRRGQFGLEVAAHVPVDEVRAYEAEYLDYLRTAHTDILAAIADKLELTDEITAQLRAASDQFKAGSKWATRAKSAA